MQTPFFIGTCTALVTPFWEDKINYPMLQQLIRRQVDAGITSLVIAGTTGESATLSDAEKEELFTKAKEYAAGRCKIIAGTGSSSTAHAVELSITAEKAGADGLLIVSPYYNKSTPEGLWQHYLSIAHAVSIPIILYNVPTRTGVDIPVSVYQRLSHIPQIVGVKEASADITKISQILHSCGPDFSVWTGNDSHTVAAMALGARGVISVLSNLFPNQLYKLTQAAVSGDFSTAAAMQKELLPMTEMMFWEVNPIPVKEAMAIVGYDCGPCRLPLVPLSDIHKEHMCQLLKHSDFS